jgi:hypothetical protein
VEGAGGEAAEDEERERGAVGARRMAKAVRPKLAGNPLAGSWSFRSQLAAAAWRRPHRMRAGTGLTAVRTAMSGS